MMVLGKPDLERIWFGCGNFGGIGSSPSLRSAGDSEQQALQLLDQARRIGLRRFDTANTYGGGASETILGKWLGPRARTSARRRRSPPRSAIPTAARLATRRSAATKSARTSIDR
jgi:aryl-alcohol dehydrogenase-like predicted oxidoreductase